MPLTVCLSGGTGNSSQNITRHSLGSYTVGKQASDSIASLLSGWHGEQSRRTTVLSQLSWHSGARHIVHHKSLVRLAGIVDSLYHGTLLALVLPSNRAWSSIISLSSGCQGGGHAVSRHSSGLLHALLRSVILPLLLTEL